ncbi:hypothetical protein ILUMI_10584 [Ignelater luminosus]|uniref:Uncharacterized protein n=1 Tax=Ignelater luminosus TaxID=2038154 RepID=A0A8K0GDH5_IGNLU|nr:hypothetical protein ILUMI_10584 [Ignelater luminosus]
MKLTNKKRRIEAKVAEGDVSRGIRLLSNEDNLAIRNEDNYNFLLKKHKVLVSTTSSLAATEGHTPMTVAPDYVFKAVFSFSTESLTEWSQAPLPIKSGGIGVRRFTDLTLLASIRSTSVLIGNVLPPSLCDFEITYMNEALAGLISLIEHAAYLTKKVVEGVIDMQQLTSSEGLASVELPLILEPGDIPSEDVDEVSNLEHINDDDLGDSYLRDVSGNLELTVKLIQLSELLHPVLEKVVHQ